jgi:hypothetical protein
MAHFLLQSYSFDFTYSEGALREGQQQQIAERFAPILAKWEGFPNHPHKDWGYDGNMWSQREVGAFIVGPSSSQS